MSGRKGVRRVRGDHLESGAGVLQPAERADEVAVVRAPRPAQRDEAVAVHGRELAVPRLLLRALDLVLAEFDQRVEVAGDALLQEVVAQHAEQRRGEAQRAAERDAVGGEPLERAQQRQVGVRHRLVEPSLLHDRRILRMAEERQVGVEDEGEISGRHSAAASGSGRANGES